MIMPTFIDPLQRTLQIGADRTAVLYEGSRTSYRDLWTRWDSKSIDLELLKKLDRKCCDLYNQPKHC